MFPRPFGKYMLERELSRGGMARVLLATLRGTDGFEKQLVVKQIRDELAGDPGFVERFVTEAKTAVLLNHPNIVPVFELGVEQGTYFLTMELVRGVSVAELIQRGKRRGDAMPFGPYEGAYLGAEICRALEYAHRTARVVHRDITPRNVMLDEEGQVKIIDFGIAAKAQAIGEGIFGSPGHMPPEQMRGEPLGPRADLFAVAVLLMEAWSGKALFRRATKEECEEAMQAPHPKPSELDPALGPLDYIVGRALSLAAFERPETAGEMGRAFRKYLQSADTTDLAKELGDKVRRMLAERDSIAPGPNEASKRELEEGGTRNHETRTFAARPITTGEQGQAPSTRRIPDELESQAGPLSAPPASIRSVPRAPESSETLATRPLETPASVPRSSVRPGDGARSRWWIGVAGILAAGFALKFAIGGNRTGTDVPVQPSATTASATVAGPPSAPATTPVGPSTGAVASGSAVVPSPSVVSVPSIVGSRPHVPAPTASASSSRVMAVPTMATAPSASSTVAAAPGKKARLTLLCDPNTTAFVDGIARGGCPIRGLEINKGVHDVRFSFEPTGESRGERVMLDEGDAVTVRADFTAAVPQVRVTRP